MKTVTYDETQWQLVPREPTQEMLVALEQNMSKHHWDYVCRSDWKAMLAAAPRPSVGARPKAYLVEGFDEFDNLISRQLFFKMRDAKSLAAKFAEHYQTVTIHPLGTIAAKLEAKKP